MLFRKANVVVSGGVMCPEGSPLTDQWFINLMKKQASKIDSTRSIHLIEIRKRMSGYARVRIPAAAPLLT
jgi:hypothetical protein